MNSLKMYEWHGINPQGQRVQGKENAINSKNLYTVLQNRGITVLKIKLSLSLRIGSQKISAKKLAEWTRQLAILLQANIDLVNSLQITIQEDENSALKKLITTVKNNIENGMSFAESLMLFPQFFDKIYCGLIQAGEQSSTLGKMLNQLADYQDQMLILRDKIIKALFYPAAVATVAILVTAGLLIFVVPQFKNIFNSFNAQLPLFTQTVIYFSNLLQIHAKKFILLLISFTIIYKYFIFRSSWLKMMQDKLFLQLPFVGSLLNTAISSRWTRILATLLNAEISLIEALQITVKTIPNQSIQNAMHEVIQNVSAGETFYQALSKQHYFSRKMTQMIAVGENAGQLATMLLKLAEIQQAALNHCIEYLAKWLEPAIMVILAIITGGLIIAMYLPVFKLGAVM